MNSFKVWLLNNDVVEKIVIFNGDNVEDFGIFSDEELEWVDSDNTIISRAMLHADDSICDIKHKIARELQCNYQDIYMFCYKKRKINLSKLMASFTTRESLQQFMKNIDLDGINVNKTFAVGNDEERVLSLKTSLGMQVDDWLFSPNPFHTTEASGQRVSYDDGVLLGDDIECNNIYVCLAKDVDESLRGLYFPHEAALPPSENMETIHEMYQIYYNRPREIVSNNGIESFTLEIKTDIPLSLNLVFRNLHCDADFPFVQYNRGFHTENIYRLFGLSITKNGKRIPLLNKDKITELAKITTSGEIAIYNMVHNLVIVIDKDGVVKVSGTFTELKKVSELETILKTVLNSLFAKYCNYQFNSFDGHRVRINYQYSTVQPKPVTMNSQHVDAIFGKEYRYKRVAHYAPMSKFKTMLYDTYDKHGSNELVMRHKINQADAAQLTQEFDSKNPGARVMVMNIGNNFMVRVFELDSVDYVRHLNIYLDSLVFGVGGDKTLIKRRYVETMVPKMGDYEIDYPEDDNEDGVGFSDDEKENPVAEDEEEKRRMRNIWLENNFFMIYRSLALANADGIENQERISKAGSVAQLVRVIKEMMEPVAIFSKISKSVLESLSNDEKNMSALVENERQMLFPKRNLLTREENCEVYAARMAEEFIKMKRSIDSQDLDVHDNEFIVLESLLNSKDYFLDMVASEKNDCLRIVPSDKSWRLFAGTNRLEFLATPECSFGPLVYILHQVKNKLYKLTTIKKMLWKAYNVFFLSDKDKIAAVTKKGVDVEELMMSEAYYMTANDMEIFAKVYDLPVMLFSTADRSMKKLGGERAREFFFYESTPGFQGWPKNVLIDRLLPVE
jgi:hypothetical protein